MLRWRSKTDAKDSPSRSRANARLAPVCIPVLALLKNLHPAGVAAQRRLKYWTARSCFSAAARLLKVPRLRRFPVFGSILLEYSR